MKILITGAKGFVGKNLVASLENIRDNKDRVHSVKESRGQPKNGTLKQAITR